MPEITSSSPSTSTIIPSGFTGDEEIWETISKACEIIYPFLVIFGLFLNSLNIIGFSTKSMKRRTNALIALVSLFDITFIILLSLNMVARYPSLTRDNNCISRILNTKNNNSEQNLNLLLTKNCTTLLYRLYVKYKGKLTAFINFSSTTSIWLTLYISSERLIAIKTPLHLHKINSKGTLICIVILIMIFSGILTLFHNFAYKIVENNTSTNLTGLNNGIHSMKPTEHSFYIQIAAILGVFFQVIIPIILLFVTNGLLLYYLKTRNKSFQIQKWNPSKNSFDFTENKPSSSNYSNNDSTRYSKIWSRRYIINERKVITKVTCIVCCFVITNLPSAFLFLWIYVVNGGHYYTKKIHLSILLSTTIIIVIGKIANFFFLCHSFGYYRRQLRNRFIDPFRTLFQSTDKQNSDSHLLQKNIQLNKLKVQI